MEKVKKQNKIEIEKKCEVVFNCYPTVRFDSTKSELKFCVGSNPACGMSGVFDSENNFQWSQLEIGHKCL